MGNKVEKRTRHIHISSEFGEQLARTTSRGIVCEKPKLIVKYNKHKCGIDLSDQMLSY